MIFSGSRGSVLEPNNFEKFGLDRIRTKLIGPLIPAHKDAILDAAIEDEEKESTGSITVNPAECEIVCNPETFDPQVWL